MVRRLNQALVPQAREARSLSRTLEIPTSLRWIGQVEYQGSPSTQNMAHANPYLWEMQTFIVGTTMPSVALSCESVSWQWKTVAMK